MAVTVGLLGELGYVGIDAVLVPTPPQHFSGGVREPVEIPRKLAEVVRGERNIVLQRVDMQLHNLGPSAVLIARTPQMNGCPHSVIRLSMLEMVSLTGVPSRPSRTACAPCSPRR